MNTLERKLHIRWMIRRDLTDIIAIEKKMDDGFDCWDEDSFIDALKSQRTIGSVVENEKGLIHGYMVYTLHPSCINVERIVVGTDVRRCGIGTAMINKLKSKFSSKRTHLKMWVRETNLDLQIFLRSQGFKAIKTRQEGFQSEHNVTGESRVEDYYLFSFPE